MAINKPVDIAPESNTYFASLLSQKYKWEVHEIVDLCLSLLEPFNGLDISKLDKSSEVEMLMEYAKFLECKNAYYKGIVEKIVSDNGFKNDEIAINVFNCEAGTDVLSLLKNISTKNGTISKIKSVKLFGSKKSYLQRAKLLLNMTFPSVNVQAYCTTTFNEIENECKCDAIYTINLFVNTLSLADNIHKAISELIIKSHYIYSHNIFVETIDSENRNDISELECKYYWETLEMTRFSKNTPKSYTIRPNEQLKGQYAYKGKTCYAVFSTLTINDLLLNREYKIVLPNLCPGVPVRKLFNQNRMMLFYEGRPFDDTDLSSQFDNEEIVSVNEGFLDIQPREEYTLARAIMEFPQYQIAEALDKNEEWAKILFDFYKTSAENGHSKIYNNLGVLVSLMDSKDEYDAIDSDYNQEAIKYFSLAAESGCSDAMINLASLYASKNLFDDAMKYYELAYKNGSPLGAYSLAIAHHFGIGGFSVDYKKAIELYRKAFELHDNQTEEDGKNHTPLSSCCLNLIILLYENRASLCEITKEYNKVKDEKRSDDLKYAYTVISNNLSNRADNLFAILCLDKSNIDELPSYKRYNYLSVLHNGVVCGKKKLKKDSEKALAGMLELAETGCPDWPEWEKYIWKDLALWTNKDESNSTLAATYWIKASSANPERSCAYQTNMALFNCVDEEEKKAIWQKYAYGHGCPKCHECSNYNSNNRCCPKAQYRWAKDYETDEAVSDFLIKSAASQGYESSILELCLYQVQRQYAPDKVPAMIDLLMFNFGHVPSEYDAILDKLAQDKEYKSLSRAADLGSRRAASILEKVSKLRHSNFEIYYWNALSANLFTRLSFLEELSEHKISEGYFEPTSLIEQDYLDCANKIAEQLIGNNEDAFELLKKLADFYIDGLRYRTALKLYQLAEAKNLDVKENIEHVKELIEEEEKDSISYDRYDDYDDYHDYGRDTWDALTDGMYGDYPGDGFDYDVLGF